MIGAVEHMEQLGVAPALFKKWQAEDVEADEPAPFQTQHDALILAQRRQGIGEEAVSLEGVVVGKTATDRTETAQDIIRRAGTDVEQIGGRERAGSH